MSQEVDVLTKLGSLAAKEVREAADAPFHVVLERIRRKAIAQKLIDPAAPASVNQLYDPFKKPH